MHELSIAQALVRQASAAAAQARAVAVRSVRVAVGELSGVEAGALAFCYDLATEGTLLAGSKLELETLPVEVFCQHCQRRVALASVQRFRCPDCNQPSADLRQGRELELRSIELEVEDPVESSVEDDTHPGEHE